MAINHPLINAYVILTSANIFNCLRASVNDNVIYILTKRWKLCLIKVWKKLFTGCTLVRDARYIIDRYLFQLVREPLLAAELVLLQGQQQLFVVLHSVARQIGS